jgi:hypothetical protein
MPEGYKLHDAGADDRLSSNVMLGRFASERSRRGAIWISQSGKGQLDLHLP